MELAKNKMKKKAIIISIKGSKLTNKEKQLFLLENPWGLILFKRNITSLIQIKRLIQNVRKLTKDNCFPILIDEEGAAVSRLKNIINHNTSANFFGKLYSINKQLSIKLYKEYLKSLSKSLKYIGVNIKKHGIRHVKSIVGNTIL